MQTPKIAIAGASGFVGRSLVQALSKDHDIVALSRGSRAPTGRVTWCATNLFNLLQTERALEGVDTAYYLVHSMMPTSRLVQGSFVDLDLICADNFARAAQVCGVKHLIYLSGLMPDTEHLSPHLRSRLEVEHVLAAHQVPLTTLRAGLVIGPQGSSYQILSKLVHRLPVMVMPSWGRRLTQPVALQDVIALLRFAYEHPDLAGHAYDIGCPSVMSYREMLERLGDILGKHTRILSLPLQLPQISLLWVSLVTGTSPTLVNPLLASLKYDMVARDGLTLQKKAQLTPVPFEDAVRAAEKPATTPASSGKKSYVAAARTVLSVQRFHLPKDCTAEWVADEYARWLPKALWPFIRVKVDDGRIFRFSVPPFSKVALVLSFAPKRSSLDRQLFYITGGWLVRTDQAEPGRFEFRAVPNEPHILAAIHDYVPRLPWLIYKFSQALIHRVVMRLFGRHLRRVQHHGAP